MTLDTGILLKWRHGHGGGHGNTCVYLYFVCVCVLSSIQTLNMCYVYSCVCSIYSVWIICGINVLLDHGLIVQFIFYFL